MQSYLSNRKSFVTVEDVFLDTELINSFVLQGSTLQPILFLIYHRH